MTQVTLSPKFQVVIPKEARDAMHLSARQKIQVIPYGNCTPLIPERPIASMQGFLKGMDTSFERE